LRHRRANRRLCRQDSAWGHVDASHRLEQLTRQMVGVPIPADAKLILPGLALAWAMNSGTVATGSDGLKVRRRQLSWAKGAGRHIYIPSTREALTCWGYMQAMQDLSVLADENGNGIMDACPLEQTTTLQII